MVLGMSWGCGSMIMQVLQCRLVAITARSQKPTLPSAEQLAAALQQPHSLKGFTHGVRFTSD